MKIKHVLSLAAVAAMSLSAAQSASAREFADIYTECGLGAMIAPSNAVVAAITNITWDLGTTAVSSNVSSPDTCQGGKAKTAAYIMQSYAQLEQDLARGEGEHLSTLMTVAGCQAGVGSVLRQDLAARVAAPSYGTATRAEQAGALYNRLQATGACAV